MVRNKLSILILFFLVLFSAQFFTSCGSTVFDKEKYGNCADEVKNQNEEGVDCGGYCMPCSSCEDGEKNANETGIDCGGDCIPCSPACAIPAETMEFSIHPPNFSSSINGSPDMSYSHFLSNYSEANFYVDNSIMDEITIEFKSNFNTFDFIPLNETMVFTTIEAMSSSSIYKTWQVRAHYRASLGFENYTGYFLSGQKIYLTKISETKMTVRFCDMKGTRNDNFSMNAILTKI